MQWHSQETKWTKQNTHETDARRGLGADGRERGRGNRRKLSRWRHCDVSKTEKLHRFRPVELAIAGDAGDSPSVGLQSPSFPVSQFPSCSSNSAFSTNGIDTKWFHNFRLQTSVYSDKDPRNTGFSLFHVQRVKRLETQGVDTSITITSQHFTHDQHGHKRRHTWVKTWVKTWLSFPGFAINGQ